MLLLIALACTDDPDDSAVAQPDPLEWAVAGPGEFAVGYHETTHTYTDPMGLQRSIPIGLWYPSTDTEGRAPEYLGFIEDLESFEDATVAASVFDPGFPVHVYSHGNQVYPQISQDLMRHLASHGWVAVAPGHTDNMLSDYVDPKPTSIYIHRATDISAALDWLDTSSPVAGRADLSQVILSGHSFGAYSTWSAGGATMDSENILAMCDNGTINSGTCTDQERAAFQTDLSDDRVVGIIPMAGTMSGSFFGDDGHLSVNGPVLFMSGTADQVGQQEEWEGRTGIDFTWIEIEGACHGAFNVGACSELEDEDGFEIVNAYSLALGRSLLLDDAGVDDILDGSEVVSEYVTFQRRTE